MESSVIDVKNVSVVKSGVTILNEVEFAVSHGERVIVAGENGAGKTTLLKTILGLFPVTTGEIRVFSRPIGSREWKTARKRLGYVNQESVQVEFPISAREVVEIGLAMRRGTHRRERAMAAMEQTGTSGLEHRDYRVLSGGEKQRVSIARCLAQDASVLLLDEPGAFLDADARRDVVATIDRLNADAGIAVLLVTHQPDEVTGWRMLRLYDGEMREAV